MMNEINESKWIPAGYRIKVKLRPVSKEVEEKTESGLIVGIKTKKVVDQEQYANQIADVVAVGQSAWEGVGDGKSWCKVDDVVLIARYAGQNRDDEETGDIYSFINDQDIIAYQRGNNE